MCGFPPGKPKTSRGWYSGSGSTVRKTIEATPGAGLQVLMFYGSDERLIRLACRYPYCVDWNAHLISCRVTWPRGLQSFIQVNPRRILFISPFISLAVTAPVATDLHFQVSTLHCPRTDPALFFDKPAVAIRPINACQGREWIPQFVDMIGVSPLSESIGTDILSSVTDILLVV